MGRKEKKRKVYHKNGEKAHPRCLSMRMGCHEMLPLGRSQQGGFGRVQNGTCCQLLKFSKMRKRLKTQPKNMPSSTSKILIPSQHTFTAKNVGSLAPPPSSPNFSLSGMPHATRTLATAALTPLSSSLLKEEPSLSSPLLLSSQSS